MLEIVKNPNFEFIGLRRKAIGISIAIVLAGIIFAVIHGGLNYGIDFTGGAAITLKFDQQVEIENIRQALSNSGFSSSEVTHFGDKNHVLVRLQLKDTSQDYMSPMLSQFNQAFPGNTITVEQNDLVGPKIGTELRQKALLALLFSWIGMIIYISIRFETESFLGVLVTLIFGLIVLSISQMSFISGSDFGTISLMLVSLGIVTWVCLKFNFKYAVGAIVALIHDVLVTVAVLVIFNKQFDLNILAALLTIVGFSINDTIVLFDRIREEYPKERKRLPLDRIINRCINFCFSRTIITSGTVFLSIIVLLVFGGEVIRPFALAMTIGTIAGTWSTIYLAAPVLIWWHERFGEGHEIVGKKVQA